MNYLDVLGGRIRSKVPRPDLPDANTDALFRIYAVLLLAKGAAVTAEDVHNAWVAWMSDQNPDHDSLKPFGSLTDTVADDDVPYMEAICSVAKEDELGRQ